MMNDVENGKVGIVITKDLSRLGRDYLKTGELIELTFPDYNVRYIAINDNVDTFKSENELMAFKNIFNDWYARDCSKKICAVLKAKGESGKPIASIAPYGYKKSETDKNVWIVDDEAAEVVHKIFRLCIDGYGPTQIARILTEQGIPTPTAYYLLQGKDNGHRNANLTRWEQKTISKILESPEYLGHTVNFKTHTKSYKIKKIVNNPKEDWLIFENTHEAIVSQHDFDLVQELRKNKRKLTKCEEVNLFLGIVFCADCGKKLHLNRGKSLTAEQEHLKCSTYSADRKRCSAHYIRTCVLKEIIIAEINKLLGLVNESEDEFINLAMEYSATKQISELQKAKKTLNIAENRIIELDQIFKRLYEDNLSGKISDERFSLLSADYESEQKQLKDEVVRLKQFFETAEMQADNTTRFVELVRKYEKITELTPEIMHELIEKIIIHAPDKSSGHRTQQIDIHFRFNVAKSTAIADSMKYDKKRKVE